MAQKILITGASGLIGKKLTSELISQGHGVAQLSRTASQGGIQTFTWNVNTNQIDAESVRGVDTIVHLAGAGVAEKRWTASRKKEIIESRTKSTQLLYETLKNKPHQVRSFISASAIGYYGTSEEKVFTESDSAGNDFLSEVTKQWEAEVDKISSLGIRVVKIRIGVVLSKTGGALEKIKQPVEYFVGAPLGSGNQFISWIHLDDLVAIFAKAIQDEKVSGAYNATAGWTTNTELTKAIAHILNKPIWLPHVPSFVLKLALGEMASIVLNGSKISSQKIIDTGFQFRFPKLEEALVDLIRN